MDGGDGHRSGTLHALTEPEAQESLGDSDERPLFSNYRGKKGEKERLHLVITEQRTQHGRQKDEE